MAQTKALRRWGCSLGTTGCATALGVQRLRRRVLGKARDRSADGVLREVERALAAHLAGGHAEDDLTMIAVKLA